MRCLLPVVLAVGFYVPAAALASVPGTLGPLAFGVSATAPVALDGPAFYVERLTLPAGETVVVPFRLKEAASRDKVFDAGSGDEAVLEVLAPGEVLEGHALGYLRVRTGEPGETTLRLDWQELPVSVEERPGAARPEALRGPRIVSPAEGAFVWETFSVAVEIPSELAGEGPQAWRSLRLLAGERRVADEPEVVGGPGESVGRFAFEVEAGALPPGLTELRVEAIARDGRRWLGPVRRVGVLRVDADAAIAGEAEAVRLRGEARPGFGRRNPRVDEHEEASGGRYSAMYSAYPGWCLPLSVETAGHYQLFVRAAADSAGTALPSVRVHRDEERHALTTGRLCREGFHRAAIGAPVYLEAGEQVLTLVFANDFAGAGVDRNLFLDRYELLRVEEALAARTRNEAARAALALSRAAPSVALTDSFHGRFVGGRLEVGALARFAPGDEAAEGHDPRVTLFLNDRAVSVQSGRKPVFRLERALMREGRNRLRVEAGFAGIDETAASAEHVFYALGETPQGEGGRYFRFTATDPHWAGRVRRHLGEHRSLRGERVVRLYSPEALELVLPESLSGRFEVTIEARGDTFKGPPRFKVSLHTARGATHVNEEGVPFWGGWSERGAGTVELEPGPKRLRLSFENDLYEKDKGDRNLFLRAVVLEEVAGEDGAAPGLEVAYPPAGHAVHSADAVVVRAWDNVRVDRLDLHVNGEPLGLRIEPDNGEGLIALPLFVEGLEPGKHTWRVSAVDGNGNETLSEPVDFELLAEPPAEPGPYARAVHLLNRLGFGPEPAQLARVLSEGEAAWLERVLHEPADNPALASIRAHGWLHYPDAGNRGELWRRTLEELSADPNPVRARFLLWVQNHFSTWERKTGAARKALEHEAFSRAGFARFGELLWTSASSPAMLYYLDQHKSFKGKLNENYAREILELHTFGVDRGYTQEDVTRLAGLLTGWTFAEEAGVMPHEQGELVQAFRFDPALNDGEAVEIVGVRFEAGEPDERYDRVRRLLQTLAGAPYTARFISEKLAAHYISVPPPQRAVADLARVYMETGGSLRAMFRELAAHPDFWAGLEHPRMTKPQEFGLRIVRLSGGDGKALAGFLNRSGMALFGHPTPDGYPEEDSAYTSSNGLLQRWRFVQGQKWTLWHLVPPGWRGEQSVATRAGQERLLQMVAQRLTGYPLSPASLKSARRALASSSTEGNDRIHEITALAGMLPESNLR